MRLTLTAQQETLRREFSDFADTEVAPFAAVHDSAQRLSDGLVARLAAAGYLAASVPTDRGGHGLEMVAYGLLHEEIGRACSATRSLLTVHDMVASAVLRWGTAEQRDSWLPRLTAGEAVAAYALSEPGVGSDAAAVTTVAKPDGDDVVLTGVKTWISCGQLADVFLVFARGDDGVSAYLVPRATPGLEIAPIDGMLGTRGAMLAELRFTNCRLHAASRVGPAGRAHPFVTASTLTLGRYSVACGSVGIARACLDASLDHTQARGLDEHQLVQRLLARMAVRVDAARLLALQAGELVGRRDPDAPMAVARAKYFAAEVAAEAAADAVQLHGAAGCAPDAPAQRFFRDAKVMEIIEGSSQILESLIGRSGSRALLPADGAAPKAAGR